MKKLLPYFLICVYSTIILKPVMPYITDGVAHILNFEGHMATVHAHNGKYHVHTELTQAEKNDSHEKGTSTSKKEANQYERIFVDKDFVAQSLNKDCKYFTALSMTAVSIYLDNDFPPPKA